MKAEKGTTYIVGREFRINGWTYVPGDVFDWGRIAIPLRKVQMLLNAGLIKTEARAEKKGLTKAKAVAVEPVAETVEETTVVDTPVEVTEDEVVEAPPPVVKQRGRPRK
jgi:hypothetical protein